MTNVYIFSPLEMQPGSCSSRPARQRQRSARPAPRPRLPHASLGLEMLQAADLQEEEGGTRASTALQNSLRVPSLPAGSLLTSVPRNANRYPLRRRGVANRAACAASGAEESERRCCGIARQPRAARHAIGTGNAGTGTHRGNLRGGLQDGESLNLTLGEEEEEEERDNGRERVRATVEGREAVKKHKSTNPCLLARLLREPEGTNINLKKIFVFLFSLAYFSVRLPFRAFVWRQIS